MNFEPDNMEQRFQSLERNIKRSIKKRIKKMRKKIIELQKSMLSDVLFLCSEQYGDAATASTEANRSHPTGQLPETPISTIEKFLDFEQKLKSNAKLQNNLISSFLAINCDSPGEFIRICWSKILTNEVAGNFSWKIATTQNSICNRLISKTIKKAFALKFPLNQEKFDAVTQKYFQYAKDRSVKLDLNDDSNVEMKSPKRVQKCREKLEANKGRYEAHLQKEKERHRKRRELRKHMVDEERLAEIRRKDRIRQQRCRERKRNKILMGNARESDYNSPFQPINRYQNSFKSEN